MSTQTEKRLIYLAELYGPSDECEDAKYKCDFRVDDGDECPCQWASKLNPNWLDKMPNISGADEEN